MHEFRPPGDSHGAETFRVDPYFLHEDEEQTGPDLVS